MEKPIHTFFKFIKEDETKYITHDSITRYYEMLRYLMKANKLFGGKEPISHLYTFKDDYKKELTQKYTAIDIILFEFKLEVIKSLYIDKTNYTTDGIFKQIITPPPPKKSKIGYLILAFMVPTIAFLLTLKK